MFIKDNIDHNSGQRIAQRAATTTTAVPSVVQTSHLDYLRKAAKEHIWKTVNAQTTPFNEDSFDAIFKNYLFSKWVNNLFNLNNDVAVTSIDNTEFLEQLNLYARDWPTADIVSIINNAIDQVDFFSAANQTIINNASATATTAEIIAQFNPPHGATGTLVSALKNNMAAHKETNSQIALRATIAYINAELAKFGVADLNATTLLKDYITNQYLAEANTLINGAFNDADPFSPSLSIFKSKASFEQKIEDMLAKELYGTTPSSTLQKKFFDEIHSLVFNRMTILQSSVVSAINKEEAAILTAKQELTLADMEGLIPGTKAFFDAHPAAIQYTHFNAEYNDDKTQIIIRSHFSSPSDTFSSDGGVFTTDPIINVNNEKPIVDIVRDELNKLLINVPQGEVSETDIINAFSSVNTVQDIIAAQDGQFHKIELSEFNDITGYNIDFTALQHTINRTYELEAYVKYNKDNKKLEFKFIAKDPSAKLLEHQAKDIAVRSNISYIFLYEKLAQEIKNLEDLDILNHPILNMFKDMPTINTKTYVGDWFLPLIDKIKLNVLDKIKLWENSGIIAPGRIKIKAYVDNFNSQDSGINLFFEIEDTSISTTAGSSQIATQRYRLNVWKGEDFEKSRKNMVLQEFLSQLTGKPGSIFSSSNLITNPNPSVPVNGDPSSITSWDDAAQQLNGMIEFLDSNWSIDGKSFSSFKDMYQYLFKDFGIDLEWDKDVIQNPDDSTSKRGILFHYFVKYYENIFSPTAPTIGHGISRKEFKKFSELEYIAATDAEKAEGIDTITKEADKLKNMASSFPGLSPDEINLIKLSVDAIVNNAKSQINVPGLSKKKLDKIVELTLKEFKKLVHGSSGQFASEPWFKKLLEMFNGDIPQDILDSIIKNPTFFKNLVDSGQSLESIKMLARHKKLMQQILEYGDINTVTKVLDGFNTLHQNYKYAYLGLGVGLGAAGLASGGLAVNAIRANKKIGQMQNRQIKMRGTKIVSTIATGISLTTLLSSVVFMVLFFVNKGGF